MLYRSSLVVNKPNKYKQKIDKKKIQEKQKYTIINKYCNIIVHYFA